jgi:hypothetical protein
VAEALQLRSGARTIPPQAEGRARAARPGLYAVVVGDKDAHKTRGVKQFCSGLSRRERAALVLPSFAGASPCA